MATILVVDDRPVNRELLTTLLGYAGHRLLEAASGQEGLAIARVERPDLIITDIVMPAMDGYEFARLVRADAQLSQTQVVFYTSSYVIAETRRLADACGVEHIIAKPAEPEDILLTVDLALATKPQLLMPPATEAFHEEHMRLLTDKLAAKVDELEAENRERQRVAQALQASEAELRALFAAMTDVIVVLDQDGTYLKIAPTSPRDLYRPAPELIGRRLHDVLPREQAEAFVARIRQALAADQPLPFEYSMALDGETLWFEATLSPMGPGSVFLVARDISARKQAEEAVRLQSAALNAAANGIIITNREGRIEWINPAVTSMTGYTLAEAVGKNPGELFKSGAQDQDVYRDLWDTILAGQVWQGELVNRRKDGSLYVEEQTITPLKAAGGGITHFISVKQDITARKQAEAAQRESEVHLRTLLDNVPISIWEEDFTAVMDYLNHLPGGRPADLDGYLSEHPEVVAACIPLVRVLDVNQATLNLMEEPDKTNLLGGLVVALPPEARVVFQRELVAMARGETRLRADAVVLTRSGQRREVSLDWVLVPGHERNYSRVLLSLVDITERKRAEQVLAQTNDLLSRAEQIGHIGSYSREVASNQVVWSDGLYRLFGVDKQGFEPSFEAFLARVHPDDRERVRETIARAYREPGTFQYESRIVLPDGQTRVADSRGEVQVDEQGQPAGASGLIIDITEQRQAEEARRESEQRYRLLFELNPMPMWVYDIDSLAFVAVNDAAVAHYGYSQAEFMGMTVGDIQPREETARLRNDLAAGPLPVQRAGSWKHHKKDGTLIDVESVSHRIAFDGHAARLVLAIDVSERLKAEAQVQRQLARLAALRAIDMAISASLDLRLTLQIVLDQVIAELKVDAADVYLLKPSLYSIEYAAGRGFGSKNTPPSRLRLGQGYAGRVALERQALSLTDISLPQTAGSAAEGFRGYYGLPLIAKGVVTGVLEVFQRAPLWADQDWLDFLEALAGQAAIAIDNSGMFGDLQQSNQSLNLAYEATIEGWSRALDLRDQETEGHSRRVTELSLGLAARLGIEPAQMIHIRRGALLHDIGKMAIPDNVLLKPGPLTDDEWVIMRQHPVYAYDLLAPIQYLHDALDIPYCHHEKWDGSGYPRQLKGEAIPLAARIFAVVDVWDALCSDRPYRRAWPRAQVRAHIRAGAGTHFDPAVVTAFEQLLDEEP